MSSRSRTVNWCRTDGHGSSLRAAVEGSPVAAGSTSVQTLNRLRRSRKPKRPAKHSGEPRWVRTGELTTSTFERYTGDKLKEGRSPKSVRNDLVLLGLMFKQARRWRWVSENPLELVEPPPAD